ncbi:MAG: hypothetical protein OEZ43_05770 [Gammaproteobacteria bacterium]|nr:hypothetical protein [Gammaproteobacteria bacterium]
MRFLILTAISTLLMTPYSAWCAQTIDADGFDRLSQSGVSIDRAWKNLGPSLAGGDFNFLFDIGGYSTDSVFAIPTDTGQEQRVVDQVQGLFSLALNIKDLSVGGFLIGEQLQLNTNTDTAMPSCDSPDFQRQWRKSDFVTGIRTAYREKFRFIFGYHVLENPIVNTDGSGNRVFSSTLNPDTNCPVTYTSTHEYYSEFSLNGYQLRSAISNWVLQRLGLSRRFGLPVEFGSLEPEVKYVRASKTIQIGLVYRDDKYLVNHDLQLEAYIHANSDEFSIDGLLFTYRLPLLSWKKYWGNTNKRNILVWSGDKGGISLDVEASYSNEVFSNMLGYSWRFTVKEFFLFDEVRFGGSRNHYPILLRLPLRNETLSYMEMSVRF